MKSYTSELHNLRSERGSSVYSFMGYAIIAVCVIVAIIVFPGMKFEKKEPPQDANYLSGMGALKKTQYAQAIEYFDKSIKANPNNGAAYLGKAKAELQLGNIDKALEEANAAVARKAGAEAYGQRGVIQKIKGKTDEALKDLDEAIRSDAKYAWALAHKADILSKKGDYEKALQAANKALEADNKFVEGLRLKAWILTRTGKCEEASAVFVNVEKLSPNDPKSIQDRAWFLLTCPNEKLQDANKAMELAKKAVEMSPKDGVALETLAEAYFRQGEALKAVDAQKKAIELGSKNCPDGACVKEMQQRLQKYELAARQEVRTGYEILPLDSKL
jgi:tetratricopeptide (TPR) repeat protein